MNTINLFYSEEPKYRLIVIEQLISYLQDNGKFSILILGKRGVGKSHWIERVLDNQVSNCMDKIITINAAIAKDTNESFWEEQFCMANEGVLVIDDVEELSKYTQAILFEFLSTTDGKYGWKEKKYECRIIFTSSLDIKTLRDNEMYLYHKFYDRISQFIVKFPSFMDHNSNIIQDFKATWEKMKFPEENLPTKEFYEWLNKNSHKFHGNFRDLDKLAINWNNCQNSKLKPNLIFEKVTKDFFELYHFPEKQSESNNAFYIDPDLDFYKEIKPNFLNFVKSYAKDLYGKNLSKAPEGKPFGVPWRTMERW